MSRKIYGRPIATPINPEKFGSGGSGSGEDGFSPIATVTQTAGGALIEITDKTGKTTATITNGKDGNPGEDYVLTEADKAEIAEQAAQLVEVPTDAHINDLINTALSAIPNAAEVAY